MSAKMKLSDAISLGAKLGPQITNSMFRLNDSGTCALGAACLAVGIQASSIHQASGLWPWIDAREGPYSHNPHAYDCARDVIIYFNDCLGWSRERIAEWVTQIEREHGIKTPAVVEETHEATAQVAV